MTRSESPDFTPATNSHFDISAIFHRELDSRLYVDLIFQQTQHFASFTPSAQTDLGDYGRVDKRTGEFVRTGNVFRDFPELASLKDGDKFVEGSVTVTNEGHKKIWGSRMFGYGKDIDKHA